MIPINITEDGVCTSEDGLPNRRKPDLRDPWGFITIETPIEMLKLL